MVMRPDPRMGALTRVRRRDFGPWWLWIIVVVLAGTGAYYAYKARFLDQRLAETDVVTSALNTDNTGLRASVADLERDVAAANARANKEHADAESVSGLLAKLQKRMSELQADLAQTQENAASSKKEAEQLRAKAASAEAATAQVQNLQERISALKGDVDTARAQTETSHKTVERLTAEAAAAATAKSLLEHELAGLQKDLADTRQKLEAASTAAAAPAPPGH